MFLLLFYLLLHLSISESSPFNYSLRIDCGGLVDSSDAFNNSWVSDRYYSAGSVAVVSEPLLFLRQHEKTLRYFPISSGKKNCYSIPTAAPGRYFLRTFTVYDNFDGKAQSPSFDVSVGVTVVFSWRSPWLEAFSRYGAYSDLFFRHYEPNIDLCFYSFGTDSPVIGSVELTQIDLDAYPFDYLKNSINYVLVNYGRFSSGSSQWGPGFSNDTDFFGRSWQGDSDFRPQSRSTADDAAFTALSTTENVSNVEKSPNYFPQKLYQSAITTLENGGVLEYEFPVDAKLDYLMWFHVAEIDKSVTQVGQRVFDVVVNGENVRRVDVFKEVGGFAAFDWSYVARNLSDNTLVVRLESVKGSPIICGIENYAIVPVDAKTNPDQVIAMRALKESLSVPERMGWNGDPCAPTSWVAWEGVTCQFIENGSALVVSHVDLGSQALKGYISEEIGRLTNLVSLNLSSNFLSGRIPSGLGQKSLVKLDLSNNQFTGFIPDSLTSASLQFLSLRGNLLEGQVPEELYSIGLHGGIIDLDGNKRLCGVPSLPNCSLIWGKHGLSTAAKVSIALSCLIAFCVLLAAIYCYIKRRQNDYDFGLPPEILSLAAKRNRYQRQKSLMDLEMERQHAKGFIPTYNAN